MRAVARASSSTPARCAVGGVIARGASRLARLARLRLRSPALQLGRSGPPPPFKDAAREEKKEAPNAPGANWACEKSLNRAQNTQKDLAFSDCSAKA